MIPRVAPHPAPHLSPVAHNREQAKVQQQESQEASEKRECAHGEAGPGAG